MKLGSSQCGPESGKFHALQLKCEGFEPAQSPAIACHTDLETRGAQTASVLPQRPTAPSAVVGRLVIQSLGSADWGFDTGTPEAAAGLLRLVHRLKGLIRGSSTAVMLSVPTGALPPVSIILCIASCNPVWVPEGIEYNASLASAITMLAAVCSFGLKDDEWWGLQMCPRHKGSGYMPYQLPLSLSCLTTWRRSRACGFTGAYEESLLTRLLHICDAGLVLQPVQDDSEMLRLISDPGRSDVIDRQASPLIFGVNQSRLHQEEMASRHQRPGGF